MFMYVSIYTHTHIHINVNIGLWPYNKQKGLAVFIYERKKNRSDLRKICWNYGKIKMNGSPILCNEKAESWYFTCYSIMITSNCLPQWGYFCSCHALLCAREWALQPHPHRPLACHAMSLLLALEMCQGNTFQLLGCLDSSADTLMGLFGTLIYLNLLFWRK